ncbi:MAG: DUF4249 domain-containing protein [Chitinophagaceae bacterium]
MRYLIVSVISFIFLSGCREKYDPPFSSLPKSFLVVEGNLNTGTGLTSIRLTKTVKLGDPIKIIGETNAQLTVEGKDNSIRGLTGTGNGLYTSPSLNLIIGNEYRLRIKTSAGKEYLSDYIKAKANPDIDSVSWEEDNDGLNIYVNTHDPSNATKYYHWEYTETWEQRSTYYSSYIYQNGIVRRRNFPGEDVSVCWRYDTSSTIFLANSTRLLEDVISKKSIIKIPKGNEKLAVRYSVLVKQYALEKEAYSFYELMKKNTEDLGSFFDTQPSEIRGNVHNTSDPNEYVIGYVTACAEKQKRVFITIPWRHVLPCEVVTIPNIPDSIYQAFGPSGSYIPLDFSNPPGEYTGATRICADCRLRGGSTIKPSYW